MRYLIVSIPDLCTLTYLKLMVFGTMTFYRMEIFKSLEKEI